MTDGVTHTPETVVRWHDALAISEVLSDVPVRVDVAGTPVIVIRTPQGDVRAFGAECPHKGAPLEKGAVCDGRLACPWHKAEFSLNDGCLIEPLSFDPLPVYPVEISDGRVLISPHPEQQRRAPSSRENERAIIIGGGAAGTAAAVSLREFGFAGTITLIDDDGASPYDRTALSKTVLAGKAKNGKPPGLRPDNWWSIHAIRRIRDKVAALDVGTKRITLADGTGMDADHVLIAPGSTAKRPAIPGVEKDGVFTVRHAKDAEAINSRIETGASRAVVCGGSFIAMETAASLTMRGLDVTVVAPMDVPFAHVFGERAARRLMTLHEEKGVVLRTGRRVTAITGDIRAEGVELDDGTHISADFVIMGTGVTPATDFVADLRAPDGGIDVDERLQIAPGVYVAGDAARFPHGSSMVRIEHWRTAEVQGRQVARSIMNQSGMNQSGMNGSGVFDQLPWFWTQQFDAKLEYVGYQEEFDHADFNGDAETFDFTVTLTQQGRWVGTVTAGRPKVTGELVLHGPPEKAV
ncbi:FAD-dependent oxidoreductase [Acetobacter fallax]|uniref:Rieske 2Fe-2S domain-containing protein n=1 Tax=Acetobacter fallax TaxID=1737473 RepID=A0ABX0K7Z6_9PROT|nr:FAD-dependent oxidoreductase [Acetobacter fallax]NHO31326.1 Rieske 2Fe-2S domain-containing protein [Acetobacter fallax]NHO34883.1 Rieske 2Fe-2S domain-containing protein [Acetobacter fallax]